MQKKKIQRVFSFLLVFLPASQNFSCDLSNERRVERERGGGGVVKEQKLELDD